MHLGCIKQSSSCITNPLRLKVKVREEIKFANDFGAEFRYPKPPPKEEEYDLGRGMPLWHGGPQPFLGSVKNVSSMSIGYCE